MIFLVSVLGMPSYSCVSKLIRSKLLYETELLYKLSLNFKVPDSLPIVS